MFAKRDPVLRDVITFSDDPYNAVGSFGVIVRMLIALLSFLRAFRPYREAPSMAQQVYLVRSQEAVVLAVFITLATDAVAMARYPSMWIGDCVAGQAYPENMLVVILMSSRRQSHGKWTARFIGVDHSDSVPVPVHSTD